MQGGFLAQFRDAGSMLLDLGLVGSHSGNLSVRTESGVIITRHDARLGRLTHSDLVRVRSDRGERGTESRRRFRMQRGAAHGAGPSMDLAVHLAIYAATSAQAVAHAHPAHAAALSLDANLIVPVDVEGVYHLKSVPVVGEGTEQSYRRLPETLPAALGRAVVVVHRGHGAYAIGTTLDEAIHRISSLEFSATVLSLRRLGS